MANVKMSTPRTAAPALVGGVKKKKRRATPKVAKKMVRRRKKVSGIGSELPKAMEMVLAAAAGGFVGKIIQKMGMGAPSGTSTTDYRPYVGVIGGVAAMVLIKNPIAKSAGMGCAAVSAMGLIPDKDIPQIGNLFQPQTIGTTVIRLNGGNNSQRRRIAGNSASPLIGAAGKGKYKKAMLSGGIGM